jgi:hypothetical protein
MARANQHQEERMKNRDNLLFFRFETADGETLVSAQHIQQIQPTGLLELTSGGALRNRHSLAVWIRAIQVAVEQGGPVIDVAKIEEELKNSSL